MNILLLGNQSMKLMPMLKNNDELLMWIGDWEFQIEFLETNKIDWIVSFGYRHIVSKEVLDFIEGKAINLHISYLPWNRGADPNLWSWIDDTPKGVTIHYIDEGIDTGDVIAQMQVDFNYLKKQTLDRTYHCLIDWMLRLFRDEWHNIKEGRVIRSSQNGKGSFHLKSDRKKVEHLLTKGWDTKVSELV